MKLFLGMGFIQIQHLLALLFMEMALLWIILLEMVEFLLDHLMD